MTRYLSKLFSNVVILLSLVIPVQIATGQETGLTSVSKISAGEIESLLQANEYSIFLSTIEKSGFFTDFQRDREVVIFAPTNAAWSQLPKGTLDRLLEPQNKDVLKQVLGCQVSTDAKLTSAIGSIAQNQRGTYGFDTVGGCRLTASWNEGKIAISSDFDDISFVSGTSVKGNRAVEVQPSRSIVLAMQAASLANGDIEAATRQFSGPTQFPPTDFAAYGILAFTGLATGPAQTERHILFCNAYVSEIQHTYQVPLPRSQQMITVWPIADDAKASRINKMEPTAVCSPAIKAYGLTASQQAINQVRAAGFTVGGRGPFLIAWSPPQTKGAKDAIILFVDLSLVDTEELATEVMQYWKERIVLNTELWQQGWNLEKARIEIKIWAEHFGPDLLALMSLKE